MQQLTVLFPGGGRLEAALTLVYADIMEFCIMATTTLARKSLSVFPSLIWSMLISGFDIRASILEVLSFHQL